MEATTARQCPEVATTSRAYGLRRIQPPVASARTRTPSGKGDVRCQTSRPCGPSLTRRATSSPLSRAGGRTTGPPTKGTCPCMAVASTTSTMATASRCSFWPTAWAADGSTGWRTSRLSPGGAAWWPSICQGSAAPRRCGPDTPWTVSPMPQQRSVTEPPALAPDPLCVQGRQEACSSAGWPKDTSSAARPARRTASVSVR